jgi:hypothetical protein
MKLKLIALASAAMIALTAVALPDQAEARWRRGGVGQAKDAADKPGGNRPTRHL